MRTDERTDGRADGRAYRRTNMSKLIADFRSLAIAPNNGLIILLSAA